MSSQSSIVKTVLHPPLNAMILIPYGQTAGHPGESPATGRNPDAYGSPPSDTGRVDQLKQVVRLVDEAIGPAVLGVYLHGSAVRGGLKPASDLDILVVSGRSMDDRELIPETLAGNHPLEGPPPADLLDPVPAQDVVRGSAAGIPDLLGDLPGDTRNVVLTFARIWTTLATGESGPRTPLPTGPSPTSRPNTNRFSGTRNSCTSPAATPRKPGPTSSRRRYVYMSKRCSPRSTNLLPDEAQSRSGPGPARRPPRLHCEECRTRYPRGRRPAAPSAADGGARSRLQMSTLSSALLLLPCQPTHYGQVSVPGGQIYQ
jgi:hypothetical protein